jgi:hypothetical protein
LTSFWSQGILGVNLNFGFERLFVIGLERLFNNHKLLYRLF